MNAPVPPRRSPRYTTLQPASLLADFDAQVVTVQDLSATGLGCSLPPDCPPPLRGTRVPELRVSHRNRSVDLGPARIVRVDEAPGESGVFSIGFAFESEHADLVSSFQELLGHESLYPSAYSSSLPPSSEAQSQTLDQFTDATSTDLLEKCRAFSPWIQGMQEQGLYQRFYRLDLQGPIGRRVSVKDYRGHEHRLTCFDSNSYLGLHKHPLVVEEVVRVTQEMGFGTPSAQLLCGTNKYLIALEEDLARFHAREAAMVFPSGFSANTGVLRALLRPGDAVLRDQHAHASIHEGTRKSGANWSKVFAHNDLGYLERMLQRSERQGTQAKLVVTDGVFSMHGELAPLPELSDLCRKHRARLMVDDAHGVGVVGRTGRGIEEHFDCVGSVDVLTGTLSKTLGALGGYVVGTRELIDYLRWFSPSGVFTTTLPAPICAGVSRALQVIEEEPELRERLWENIRRFVPPLKEAGFQISGMNSPIITIFVGSQETLWQVSRDLYDAGIKAGNVIYPAVPRDKCILRLTINAEHSKEDIDAAVANLITIGRRHKLIERLVTNKSTECLDPPRESGCNS